MAHVVKIFQSHGAYGVGMGIFPRQYAFIEGSILKKGHAQSNVESPKPEPFFGLIAFWVKKRKPFSKDTKVLTSVNLSSLVVLQKLKS